MSHSRPNRNHRQDPLLEIKRDGYLAEGKEIHNDEIRTYTMSISKTKHIHANLLFTTQYGYSILTSICRIVTCVYPNMMNTSWRDLAVKLGYGDVDVKCIDNLRGNNYDPTEQTLLYYAASKKEGTVGDILQALLDLKFFAALHQAQEHIEMFLAEVETGKSDVINAPVDTDVFEIKNILKAANFKPSVPAIFGSLPTKNKEITIDMVNHNSRREREAVQGSVCQTRTKNKRQYCKYVMLSFASDGNTTAMKVASVLRATTNRKSLPIGVVMLCENDHIQANPGLIITDILSKMDFVIPVLTEGYFTALERPNAQARLLDERYIQFIHNILVSKYIHNHCLNIQVRPVIPSYAVNEIYNKSEFIHNPIFSAWKTDDDVPALADNILKSHRNKIST